MWPLDLDLKLKVRKKLEFDLINLPQLRRKWPNRWRSVHHTVTNGIR